MAYFIAREAERELPEAKAFYVEQGSIALGKAFIAEFSRAAQLLAANPGLGTPTIGRRRLFPLHRFPYTLIYRVDGEHIRISVVAHQSRRQVRIGSRRYCLDT